MPMLGNCDAERIATVENPSSFPIDLPTSFQEVYSDVKIVSHNRGSIQLGFFLL